MRVEERYTLTLFPGHSSKLCQVSADPRKEKTAGTWQVLDPAVRSWKNRGIGLPAGRKAMSRTALIVEDEKDTSNLLGEHLRRWGFAPAILSEGNPVVSWVRQNRPDLILLDLLLPGVDGFTICESLKLERETNLIPIIMITALTNPEDKFHGLQVGANRYLTKPFTGTDLHKAIEEVFQWRDEIQKTGTEGEIHFRMQSDTRYLDELNHLL